MGLLDKASDAGSKSAKKPVAKAVAKAKPVAKAVAKAKPVAKAVAKAKPVAKVATAKPVKAKRQKASPKGLPENFVSASPNARRIGWFTNFVFNFGPVFGFLFSVAILDAFTTIFALVAIAALILNLFVVPIMTGRTLGDFVSRTKNITSAGTKPNFLHAFFSNSAGILALIGVLFLMIFAGSMLSSKGSEQMWASIWSVLGIIFLVLFFVNYGMKSRSETNQGLYDAMFGAFLVKHIPAEGEVSTGFIGKLESLASHGDRFTQRQEEKSAKKLADAEKAKKSIANDKKDSATDSKKNDKKGKKKTE